MIDLAEVALLAGLEGGQFPAMVTDRGETGGRIQLCDLPVVARAEVGDAAPGALIRVRLEQADTRRRELRFARVG